MDEHSKKFYRIQTSLVLDLKAFFRYDRDVKGKT